MITKIKTYPRVALEYADIISSHFKGIPWHLISISTTIEETALVSEEIKNDLKVNGCLSYLVIGFADIDADLYEEIKHEYKHLVLFQTGHAQTIIDYAKEIDKDKVQCEEGLAVNCDAGVCRSGAVGSFLAEYYGLDYQEFVKDNPNILPNLYVLTILRSVVGAQQYQ